MELLDPQGKVVARLVSSSYNFGDFKTKGYAKSVAAKQPITAVNKPPQRSPDFVFSETVTPEQAAICELSLFSLSSDIN
jgi:peroxisomal enoyl-CoA hydratase 2